MGMGTQHHATTALPSGKKPGTHCTGSWVGPRAGLDRCGKSRPAGIRSSDRPARSQSLYRLSYPAPTFGYAGPNLLLLYTPGLGDEAR